MKTLHIFTIVILLSGCSNMSAEFKVSDQSTAEFTLSETMTKNELSTYVGELIFGRFCGECVGNCAPMFRLNTMGNHTTLWADYENNYFKGTEALKFETDLNKRELIDKAYQIMRKLPKELLSSTKDEVTFGCPDCTDGCGIYIQFTTELGDKPKKFRLDWEPSDSIPKAITDYADYVDLKIKEIMK